MLINLGSGNSLFNQFIAELRDQDIQKNRLRFRRNMERIGEIFAYEISKTLLYEKREIVTSLGISEMVLPTEKPVLATILRAGLPLHQGILNYFDESDCSFVSAYRKHHKNGRFDIKLEYASSPDLTDKVLILIDPMLATGASMVLTYKELLNFGKPKHTHIVTAIASLEGVNYVKKYLGNADITLWAGAVDDELTAQSYIVPGLGDAGDLAYGDKMNLH
jgi:uracil phosphoribosyltransferase